MYIRPLLRHTLPQRKGGKVIKIKAAVKEYLIEIEVRKYTLRTIKGYRTNLNLFLRFCTEKLVKSGFVERKKKQLLPTEKGLALFWAMPDQLKSAKLTAEWEDRLGAVERGELAPEDFMARITAMLTNLVRSYRNVKLESTALSDSGRTAIGKCPRCGKSVVEGKKSFYCEGYHDTPSCGFALWKNDRFFTSKRKELTKKIAASLLKNGRVAVTGLFSEKKGVFYDATVVLNDDGGKFVRFKLEFDNKSNEKKGK